jgi:hypothetical protein
MESEIMVQTAVNPAILAGFTENKRKKTDFFTNIACNFQDDVVF